jgi:gamma-glutamyltranspeptidase
MIRSRLMVTKATPVALRGLVTAEHPLGAEVGAKILMAGGNAVDAAVATAFAMTVVEPFMSTIAGAGTMLVHRARQGETIALDFNGCAPLQARPDMFSLAGGMSTALFAWPRVQGDANVYGPRSVAVPGSVAGLTYALERVIANLADGPASAQAAVEAPRVHAEGAALDVDSRVSEKARRELARRGYTLVEREETYAGSFFAKPIAIRITSRGLDAGLDHLRPAAAAGH